MKTQNRPELKVIIDGIEYEPKPKPLLADAKVGDLCKTDLGEWIQIDDSSEPPSPVLYHFDRPFKGNIIRTEPLAPEGTAEWAWQMLNLLGLPIYHPAEGVLTIPVPYSSERFAHCYAKTGWQIHEPEPKPEPAKEPEYKVGDFIKDGGNYYIVTSPTTCVGLLNGKGYEICPKTGKIVFPSEEVLDFGNGIKGRVCMPDGEWGFAVLDDNNDWIAQIDPDALDAPMRELVEGLLKAQEESCHS